MFSSMKNRMMSTAIKVAESLFSLGGPTLLHNVGQRYLRTSGVGLGAYPVAFSPEEVEFFRRDTADAFDATRDYEEALAATGCEETDNFLKRGRYLMLHQFAGFAADRIETGDFAECGCWRGHSTFMLSRILERHGGGDFHVFDSFEGLSPYTEQDRGALAPADPEAAEQRRRHFAADYESVKRALSRFPFVRLYKGWIPERFAEVEDRQFRFVHIDVDLYQPHVDSIGFFYPRLQDGGVMVFDDYGSAGFPGARRAIDMLAARFKPTMNICFPVSGGVWIK